MLKPISEECELRRLQRALLVIEGLTFVNDPLMFDNKESLEEIRKRFSDMNDELYIIAHSALDMCKGHENWLSKIEQLEVTLNSLGIVNIEKVLEKKE